MTTNNTSSFLIYGGHPVAVIVNQCKAGACRFSYQRTKDVLNENRKYSLANARRGNISNAKKWTSWYQRREALPFATEINAMEFFVAESDEILA